MMRWWRAFLSTLDGLRWGARYEKAVGEELIALALAIPLSLAITDVGWLRIALVGSVMLMLIVELLNTAIEKLCDHLAPELSAAIKVVKDLGSAAVFFAFLLSAAIWIYALVLFLRAA